MPNTLYVRSSPMGERSFSSRVADCFVKNHQKASGANIIQLDIYRMQFPPFGEHIVDYWQGTAPDHNRDYLLSDQLCDQFIGCDRFLIAAPNWNLMVPPALSSYLLCVMCSGRAAQYGMRDNGGALKGRKAQLVLASGEACDARDTLTFCYGVDWLKAVFRLCGVTDFSVLYVQGTAEETRSQSALKDALDRAAKQGRAW